MFQLPYVGEAFLSSYDWGFFKLAFGKVMDKDEIEIYKYAISRPGAITAALNYYRNLAYSVVRKPLHTKINIPTLLIWGEKDHALCTNFNDNLTRWVPNLITKFIPDGLHWIAQHRPAEVNAALKDFLG